MYIEISRHDDPTFEVKLFAQCRWTNDGIGSYEYHGCNSFDKGHDYVELDGDILWEKELYSSYQNDMIEKYIEDNFKVIEYELCLEFSELEFE